MAHVTDYDVWHATEEAVNVQMVIERLMANIEVSKQAIARLVPTVPDRRTACECPTALQNAIITQPQFIPAKVKRDLAPIIDKYLPVAAKKRSRKKKR
jgi:5'-methylthioadenosine phosphorylase